MIHLPAPRPAHQLDQPHSTVADLLQRFLASRQTESTRKAYEAELRRVARWAQVGDLDELARLLLGHGRGAANALVMRWREHLEGLGRQPSTINRSLAALRALASVAETLGMIDWSLKVPSAKGGRRRKNLAGPTPQQLQAIVRAADALPGEDGARARAILALLLRGLRRVEVVRLDTSDLDLAQAVAWVRPKGALDREPRDLEPAAVRALAAWLEVRAQHAPVPGPLFVARGGPKAGQRIGGSTVWRVCEQLARAAQLPWPEAGPRAANPFRPHGYRHAVATAVADAHGIEVAKDYLGHASLVTTGVYLDHARQRARKGLGTIYRTLEGA